MGLIVAFVPFPVSYPLSFLLLQLWKLDAQDALLAFGAKGLRWWYSAVWIASDGCSDLATVARGSATRCRAACQWRL